MNGCTRWLARGVISLAVAGQSAAQATPLISFDRYHTVEEFEAYLESVAKRYPKLTTLVEYGRSRGGRRLLALEINNPDTGPANEKPAFYNDGNIHGGELSGGEAALYFVEYLLTNYDRDDRVTRLVDRYVFYNAPLVNPDGRWISTTTPINQRWSIRPVDEDGDGKVDEDGPEDLNGDGHIHQMRVPDPDGRWIAHPSDGRAMVRRPRGDRDSFAYSIYTEGVDNDGDGSINEDGLGGIDLNRNFPSNWSPSQFASGPFPLSEPETHALVRYITERANIAAIHTYHTSGGMILRFPTLAGQDWDYPASDLDDYRKIADDGVEHTGYTHFAADKQAIIDRMNPGHGVFNDWASNVFGVPAITTEMWRRSPAQGEVARLTASDEGSSPAKFTRWRAFEHPQLGEVEIGGWDRWIASSPPEPLLAGELERNNRWLLTFAEKTPRLEILSTAVRPSQDGASEVEVIFANVGWLATATAHASEVLRIAKPVTVRLELSNARIVIGDREFALGVLPGQRGADPVSQRVSWQVRVDDASRPALGRLVVSSEKAGTVRRTIELNKDR